MAEAGAPAREAPPAAEAVPAVPRPLLVAVTGGSASGKSTLVRRLAERLSHMRPMVVHQDHYFRTWGPDEEHLRTTNSPPGVRWDDLVRDLRRWCAGLPAGPPPRLRGRAGHNGPVRPGELILLDGHLVLWSEDVRSLCDLKVYLDVPDEERVVRRLLRDTQAVPHERAGPHPTDRTGAEALARAAAWYRRDVIPNFWRYTAPARWWADLVVPADPVTPPAFAALVAAIEAARAARRAGG